MTKEKRAVSPQMSFLDLDQNWFSSPTTKSVLNAVLSSAQQKTGAPDPDQMLRDFTSKLLSSMDVEPGEDLEAGRRGLVQSDHGELGDPVLPNMVKAAVPADAKDTSAGGSDPCG